MNMCSSPVCPNACAHGKNETLTSVDVSGRTDAQPYTFDVKFSWLSTTPLGLPVVPDV